MRKKLRYLRTVEHDYTREQMAKRIGVSRNMYTRVENGMCSCSTSFLNKLQIAFKLPDSEMWAYAKDYRDDEEVQ